MRYYVFAPNGQRFGPADLPTLQQWVNEGRVLPNSMIEEEASGMRLAASAVTGLSFGPAPFAQQVQTQQNPYEPPPGSPYSSNPYGQAAPSNYYRQMPTDYSNASDVNNAWICAVVGIMCCGPVSIYGIVLANKARQAGNPNAQAPYIVNIVVTCIWAAGLVFYGGIMGLGCLSGGL